MTELKRNRILDIEKAIAAYMVVFIHICFPYKMGIVFDAIARFAVPLYFIISGYYCYHRENEKIFCKITKKINDTVKILFIGIIVYFSWKLLLMKLNVYDIKEWIASITTVKSIVKLVLFNVSELRSHLWYLYALIYCYIVFIFINKFNLYKVSYKLMLVFIMIHLFLGEGLGFLDIVIPNFIVRNFIFMGLPFFMLGNFIRRHEELVCNLFENYKLIIMIGIGIILTVVERYIGVKNELYIGSVIVSCSLFIYAIKNKNYQQTSFLSIIGEKYSLFIYLFHNIIIDTINILSNKFKLNENLIFNYFKPTLVCIIITICAVAFYKIMDIKNYHKKKKLSINKKLA